MGGLPSKTALLTGAKDEINEKFSVSLQFPGFWENESEFLKEMQLLSKITYNIPKAAKILVKVTTGYAGGDIVVKAILTLLCESPASIGRALLRLEIQEAVAQSAHSQVKAKMEVVKEKLLSSLNEENISNKENKLDSANTACYELLILFNDEDFYLLKKPLAFAPFFVTFVSIYLVVLKAHYLITKSSQRKPDATRVLEFLNVVIRKYQTETSKARMNYVHIQACGEGSTVVVDQLTKNELYHQPNFMYAPHIDMEIKKWYQEKLEDTYSKYFDESLQMVETVLESL